MDAPTETPATSASASPGPKISQTPTVSTASPITTGTNHRVIRSTSACTGSLAPCASSTIAMMRDSTVSAPTCVTRITSAPVPFTVPPVTASPGALATGSASPVSIASSTADCPSTTVPSSGMRSPGRIISRSPGRICAIGVGVKPSGVCRRAVLGCKPTSPAIAAPARPRARASITRPSRISTTITAAASKYTARAAAGSRPGAKVATVE